MKQTIAAGQFKTNCLQLMEEVRNKHITVVITKHGVPVAKLVPIEEESINLFGALKETINIKGDIVSSIDEGWDAEL